MTFLRYSRFTSSSFDEGEEEVGRGDPGRDIASDELEDSGLLNISELLLS
jgi:hypothetical protein